MGGLPSVPESAPGVQIVSHFKYHQQRTRSGFSMVEMVIVLVMMAVVMRMALPRLNTGMYRADAAAQQVRSVFQTAQRTSLTGQHDVIVSFDTVRTELQIAEDANNDGQIQTSEIKFWRPTGDGNSFSVPPRGFSATTVSTAIVGSQLKSVNSLPSVTFHRDGSTSSDVEVYVKNVFKGRTDFRLVTLTRATGRTDLYRMSGTGTSAVWQVVQ
jgi:prepilin-type N-terminal cleavage/methylation domain-containing protein